MKDENRVNEDSIPAQSEADHAAFWAQQQKKFLRNAVTTLSPEKLASLRPEILDLIDRSSSEEGAS